MNLFKMLIFTSILLLSSCSTDSKEKDAVRLVGIVNMGTYMNETLLEYSYSYDSEKQRVYRISANVDDYTMYYTLSEDFKFDSCYMKNEIGSTLWYGTLSDDGTQWKKSVAFDDPQTIIYETHSNDLGLFTYSKSINNTDDNTTQLYEHTMSYSTNEMGLISSQTIKGNVFDTTLHFTYEPISFKGEFQFPKETYQTNFEPYSSGGIFEVISYQTFYSDGKIKAKYLFDYQDNLSRIEYKNQYGLFDGYVDYSDIDGGTKSFYRIYAEIYINEKSGEVTYDTLPSLFVISN